MNNDFGILKHSGFLFKRKLSFGWTRNLATDKQNGVKVNLASAKVLSVLIGKAINAQSRPLG
ncbi:MAG: hypothetical protein PUP91_17875 [Rhizonema sp. PD37]|nr:hypothetical protein [Rhizonema sp. PD37]